MSYTRTPEHRRLRAELIHRWRPWEHSTGPKTEAGKAKVSRNSFRGGIRGQLQWALRVLREQEEALRSLRRPV